MVIQLALTYPDRLDCGLKQLDFTQRLNLDFQPLERKQYPLYDLALTCGEEGGILPTALNAASEVAVNAFLNGGLRFTDIYTVADRVVSSVVNGKADGYEALLSADLNARQVAYRIIKEVQ